MFFICNTLSRAVSNNFVKGHENWNRPEIATKKTVFKPKEDCRDNALCFHCCVSTEHKMRDCEEKVVCGECGGDFHPTAFHLTKQIESSNYGEETPEVSNKCTKVCRGEFSGKSCSKTVLARVYKQVRPDKAIKAYVILDYQSNRSLAGSELF